MTTAAKPKTSSAPPPFRAPEPDGFVFSSAAKPHPGHQLPTAVFYRGFGPINSSTATGLPARLYDSGTRSPCWNMYSYALNNPLAFIDPTGTDACQFSDGSLDNSPETGGLSQGDCAAAGGTWFVPDFTATGWTAPPVDFDDSDDFDLGGGDDTGTSILAFGFGFTGGGGGGLPGLPGGPTKTAAPACGPGGYRNTTPQERAKVLSIARLNVGKPYFPGGGGKSSPSKGFDCSGFVAYCIRAAGIPYNYSPTSGMASNPALGPIPATSAQAGDVILFSGHAGFNDPGQSTAGSLLNAQSSATGVRYSPPSWFGKGKTLRIRVKCK